MAFATGAGGLDTAVLFAGGRKDVLSHRRMLAAGS